ncbi:MAG: hypothetical protein ACHQ2Z_08220, partial [Elusimicrobiota bacterium]
MKTWKSWKRLIMGAAVVVAGLAAGRAHAATPVVTLNIDVTVTASASVKIDGLVTSSAPSGAITWSPLTRSVAAGDAPHSSA